MRDNVTLRKHVLPSRYSSDLRDLRRSSARALQHTEKGNKKERNRRVATYCVSSNADVGAKRKIVIKIRSKLEESHMRCRAQVLGCVLMFEVQIESFFSITIV